MSCTKSIYIISILEVGSSSSKYSYHILCLLYMVWKLAPRTSFSNSSLVPTVIMNVCVEKFVRFQSFDHIHYSGNK